MPRIVLTARPKNAPRPIPSMLWILFWIVVAAAISTRVF